MLESLGILESFEAMFEEGAYHLNFFWNTTEPANAGSNGPSPGTWYRDFEGSPTGLFTVLDRPELATQYCVLVADWLDRGYQVLIVTGRPPETREVTLEWLRRRAVPYSRFHFLDKYSDYYQGAHGTSEGALGLADLGALDLCFAVEDFPGTTEYLARSLVVPVALFDRPWNGALEIDGQPIFRCRDWREIRASFETVC